MDGNDGMSEVAVPNAVAVPGAVAESDALRTLHRVFGYDAFRGEQEAIIEHVVAGGDSVVLMPTGGGKSLCYQIPALVRPGTGVVVSPLIALMQDQVDALRALGVRAGFINSTQDFDERRVMEAAFLAGSSTSSISRRSGCAWRGRSICSPAPRSPSSRSTRRTVSRSGATTSAPTTWRSPSSASAGRTCRGSP